MAEVAPFFKEIAGGPDSVRAYWASAKDGVRLRLAIWPEGDKGTVLLLPGRTEYVEKYAHAAADLAARGYSTITIDWRGQGLADRLIDDRDAGYVTRFLDYQLDLDQMLKLAAAESLPRPYFMLAHSMGGSIGLRALLNGLEVNAAVFTAPMWGIGMSARLRPVAWALSWTSRRLGFWHHYSPGTNSASYVNDNPFEDNTLTTDPDRYADMQHQIATHPELALGGPSLHWLNEALIECRRMARAPSPDIPTIAILGANERIVHIPPIHARIANWDGARLDVIDGAQHEVMMETAPVRERVFSQAAALFDAHAGE